MSYDNESLPGLSITIITKNCAPKLKECLSRIALQDYPKEKVETLIVDGGSTDETLAVARSFGAKIIDGGFGSDEEAEARRGVGLLRATHEIVANIDSDIYLSSPACLREMVAPLLADREIVATQPLFYEYRKGDAPLIRYFSLLGNTDPLSYYLHRADRFSWGQKKWDLLGQAEDKGAYFKVKFDPRRMPTLGGNGFFVRKKALLETALSDRDDLKNFNHSDAAYLLVAGGYNFFGFVKTRVAHQTGNGSILSWVKGRISSTGGLYFRKVPRKFKVYDPKDLRDNLNLIKYIIYSLTIVKPTFDAFRGFLKLPDPAWFLHPVMCLSLLYAYGYAAIKQFFKSLISWVVKPFNAE